MDLEDRHGFDVQPYTPKLCRQSQSQHRGGAHTGLFQAFSFPLLPSHPDSVFQYTLFWRFLKPFFIIRWRHKLVTPLTDIPGILCLPMWRAGCSKGSSCFPLWATVRRGQCKSAPSHVVTCWHPVRLLRAHLYFFYSGALEIQCFRALVTKMFAAVLIITVQDWKQPRGLKWVVTESMVAVLEGLFCSYPETRVR